MNIKIQIGDLSIGAELNDTPTAQKVSKALPISSTFSTWGDEIYFEIPVEAGLDESAKDEVEMGDLGYWPQGRAFCIFFGLTPTSSPGKIVPASAVNIIGKVTGDPARFRDVMSENKISIQSA